MKYIYGPFVLLLFCLYSCQPEMKDAAALSQIPTEKELAERPVLSPAPMADSISLRLEMKEHSIEIAMKEEELGQKELSAERLAALRAWWEQLPENVQQQIQRKEVELELVTQLSSTDEAKMQPEQTDPQIEQTGEALEEIIGSSPEMTFRVNTTLLNKTAELASTEGSTSIHILKKVSTDLKSFDQEVHLTTASIRQANLQTMQQWWMNLPEDIQHKIQQGELRIDLSAVALDRGIESAELLGEKSHQQALLMGDLLQQIVGFYRQDGKNYPLGRIRTQALIEPYQEEMKLDEKVNTLIRLQLRPANELPAGPI
ncbi:hypothetical protein [Saprospira grandis]|uniref:hypothetical protein n=1 Tax=Saprospira grandis TaxID=1008 RepID=UPI0022DD285A|nr:hypothetical protein [Saprospira grandis]WBM73287.1 hypothetical protein OP864_09795 [Saprospira grandis]